VQENDAGPGGNASPAAGKPSRNDERATGGPAAPPSWRTVGGFVVCRRRMKPELVALLKVRVRRPVERRELFGAEVVARQLNLPAPAELETPGEVLVASAVDDKPQPGRRIDLLTGPAVLLPADSPYLQHGDTLPGRGRS